MKVLNLKNLGHNEFKQFFNSFEDVLCDCDGVIWYLNSPIDGAAPTIQKLRSLGKNVRFVSNNCMQTFDMFYSKLEANKFGSDKDALLFPTMVLLDHLKKINFNKEIFTITGKPVKHELQKNGYKIAPNGPDRIEESIPAFQAILKDNPNVGAVVVDLDINVNYINIMLAALYLKRKDVQLYCLGSDSSIPISKGFSIVGPHYFQQMLADVAVQKPLYFAKPSAVLTEYIKNKYEFKDLGKVLFIGDSLVQDMSFANNSGFQSLLVLSGATSKEELDNWTRPIEQKPKYYIDSLSEFLELMKNL